MLARFATSLLARTPLEGGSAKQGLQVRRPLSPAAPDMVWGGVFDVPLPLRMLISYTQDLSSRLRDAVSIPTFSYPHSCPKQERCLSKCALFLSRSQTETYATG